MTAVLDLANGLDHDKSLWTGLFAVALARHRGLPPETCRAAFFASLLRHLGCTAYAATEASLAPDDIRLRNRLLHGDPSKASDVVAAVRSATTPLQGLRGLARLATSARQLKAEWTHEACGAARLLAIQLGFGPAVVLALDQVFERWDGSGGPLGLGGSDLSPVACVAQVAHLAVMFWQAGGEEAARDVLVLRSNTMLDPSLVGPAIEVLETFATEAQDPEQLAQLEQFLGSEARELEILTIATTFGEVADLQSPYTRGHASKVAKICEAAATAIGLDPTTRMQLVLAAHLHDVGHLAVPTGVWLRRQWSATERAQAAIHPAVTERVLASVPALHAVAQIAGAHHERLDGGGYHRGLGSTELAPAARLLAAADMLCALGEARPHRPALTATQITEQMQAAVASRHLDAACVAAVLTAVGRRTPAREVPSTFNLTARELEILRLLITGQTNKEMAATLGISARTVQHHTIHVYEKLGVRTRAAAALLAVRAGLAE